MNEQTIKSLLKNVSKEIESKLNSVQIFPQESVFVKMADVIPKRKRIYFDAAIKNKICTELRVNSSKIFSLKLSYSNNVDCLHMIRNDLPNSESIRYWNAGFYTEFEHDYIVLSDGKRTFFFTGYNGTIPEKNFFVSDGRIIFIYFHTDYVNFESDIFYYFKTD
ncbi:hypothetical protein B4U79_19063 [Dinothrombium tinctorium]|uniref:Uncharacterized protein n=1 Tax=Dinothrombium tinctorium TaxID=1965070 RepID=A0A443QUC9_9ACAR|nr:hypothetical protein B4U79_19063 [Dinothrombium tinctorium]